MDEPVEDLVSLRDMTASDVPAVLDVQQPGALQGLADVFPQDIRGFPPYAELLRYEREIGPPAT